jgi:hypothetical protein
VDIDRPGKIHAKTAQQERQVLRVGVNAAVAEKPDEM